MSAARELAPPVMTYDDYLAEEEVMARYDIIDGVRYFMTNPTAYHQETLMNLMELLRQYQRQTGAGRTLVAPCDVLITRQPLKTRQPDVMFFSQARAALNPPLKDPAPRSPAPELVVEILSPNETRRSRAEKIADYCAVDVRECWVVDPEAQTVEVLRLTRSGPEAIADYDREGLVRSEVFPGLVVPAAAIFAA